MLRSYPSVFFEFVDDGQPDSSFCISVENSAGDSERMAYVIESKEGGAQKLAEILPLQGTLKDGTEVSLVSATEEQHSALRAILNGIIEDGNISPPLY